MTHKHAAVFDKNCAALFYLIFVRPNAVDPTGCVLGFGRTDLLLEHAFVDSDPVWSNNKSPTVRAYSSSTELKGNAKVGC